MIIHLLAAMIWVGGSVALVFVGVPAIRILEGEPRGRAMRELGLRWRPLGYSSLGVAAITGVILAADDWSEGRSPFKGVLLVKIVDATALVTSSAAMAMRLLTTGENAAAAKCRRAFSSAVDTTMSPRKNT